MARISITIYVGRASRDCRSVGICGIVIDAALFLSHGDGYRVSATAELTNGTPATGTVPATPSQLRINFKEDLSLDIKALPIDQPILITAGDCGFDNHLVVMPGRYPLTNNLVVVLVIQIPSVSL